jgi:DNA-binding helix-hairpin-helix protein with protein kinase domain
VDAYLKRFSIAGASLPGFGPQMIANLSAYGIRTAADFVGISSNGNTTLLRAANGRSYDVSGLGPKKGATLMAWRTAMQRKAAATQPTRAPQHLIQAINDSWDTKIRALDSEEAKARRAGSDRNAAISSRWRSEQAAATKELSDLQARTASQRQSLALGLSQAQRVQSDLAWQLAQVERQERSYRHVGFARYVRSCLGG